MQQIHTDFQAAVEKFKAVDYDIMDVGMKQFDDDYYEFRCTIKELERRLGALVSLAFDDCATVYGRFKLFDSFDGLLERPIIQDELEKKYVSLVQSYGVDLKTVQELFLNYRDTPPIASNLPPISGSLTWCRGLVERVQIPMEKLQQLDRAILEREEAKEVTKVYATIVASLQEFENQKIEEWGRDVEGSSQAKLKLPLLHAQRRERVPLGQLRPGALAAARDQVLPAARPAGARHGARHLPQRRDVPLVDGQARPHRQQEQQDPRRRCCPSRRRSSSRTCSASTSKLLAAGLSQLRWNTPHADVTPSSRSRFETVNIVDEITETMKKNLTNVEDNIMEKWSSKPLMERKPKPVDREEFERNHKVVKAARYADIKDGGKEIHSCSRTRTRSCKVSRACPDWRAYVDFVNNIVVDGLARRITVSLEYFLDQIDPVAIEKGTKQPMLEIKLDLVGKARSSSTPCIAANNGKGIRDLVTAGSAASCRSRRSSSASTTTARTCARCTPTTTCACCSPSSRTRSSTTTTSSPSCAASSTSTTTCG